MKVYAIVPTNWNYDDEYYSAEGYDKPVEAYRDKAKAEARARELGLLARPEYVAEHDQDTPCYQVAEVEVPDLSSAQAAGEPEGEPAYEKARRIRREAKEEARRLALSAFKEGAKLLFEKHPPLESFGFTGYTPYFNDGDPCRYRVSADEPWVNGERSYDSEACSSGEKWDSAKKKYVKVSEPGPLYAAADDISSFIHGFDKDDIEAVFGDHTQVTVKYDRATGAVTIEQDEYSHD